MKISKFINEIAIFAENFPFQNISKSETENKLSIFLDYPSGIILTISCNEDSEIEFYFYQRTDSYTYNGERTDLHDVISVTFATFLKISYKQMSCAIFDVPHPAIDNTGEIYARYIIPKQYKPQFKELSQRGVEEYHKLIAIMTSWREFFWKSVGCPCQECKEKFNPPYEYHLEIDDTFKSGIIKTLESNKNCNQMSRCLPNWEYYKNFDAGVSVVRSERLAKLFTSLSAKEIDDFIYIQGVDSELIFNDYLNNVVHYRDKEEAKSILKAVNDSNWENPFFIPLDNMLLSAGHETLIFKETFGDRYEFKIEKEKIRNRQAIESAILFPVDEFKWNEKIDPELFESMIKEILEREPNVLRVRKVAPLNQPDGGRDLIMEYSEASNFNNKEGDSPYVVKKIIVQCKGYKKNVGKHDVTDIRDTIDFYDYDGYFLAVSSQITTPLTDNLDKLKNRGFWIDWWNRDEIEERLTAHRDILKKYRKIVEISK